MMINKLNKWDYKYSFKKISLFLIYFLIVLITIRGAPAYPIITANITKPDIVYTNTDWMLNLTVTDSDVGDTITAYTQFYVNGTVSGSEHSLVVSNNTNTNVANLSSSSFGKGATLIAEFWAGDGTNNTAKENTTQVTVHEEPEIKGFAVLDFNNTANVLFLFVLIFAYVGINVLGFMFRNFGFVSLGFFIGVVIGFILSSFHIFLTLVFLFLSIVIFAGFSKSR